MKRQLCKVMAAAAVVAMAAVGLAGASGANPAAKPIPVKYSRDGRPAGSGIAIEYAGHIYVSLAAVKTLTSTRLTWHPAGASISAGAVPSPTPAAGGYLDELPHQPYYVNSAALCWQWAKDSTLSKMQSFVNSGAEAYPCNLALPAKPSMGGQRYARYLSVLVSATGSRDPNGNNSVTMDFNLGGHYKHLTATLGLIDDLNRSAMLVKFVSNGVVLFSTAAQPGALPTPINVDLAGAQALQLVVSNISGGAPHWDALESYQYGPGAVVLANPQLKN